MNRTIAMIMCLTALAHASDHPNPNSRLLNELHSERQSRVQNRIPQTNIDVNSQIQESDDENNINNCINEILVNTDIPNTNDILNQNSLTSQDEVEYQPPDLNTYYSESLFVNELPVVINENIDDERSCPICYGDMVEDDTQILKCKHKFHKDCMKYYGIAVLNPNNYCCPICRAPINMSNDILVARSIARNRLTDEEIQNRRVEGEERLQRHRRYQHLREIVSRGHTFDPNNEEQIRHLLHDNLSHVYGRALLHENRRTEYEAYIRQEEEYRIARQMQSEYEEDQRILFEDVLGNPSQELNENQRRVLREHVSEVLETPYRIAMYVADEDNVEHDADATSSDSEENDLYT